MVKEYGVPETTAGGEYSFPKPPDKLREKIIERIKAHFGAEGFVSQAHYEAHVGLLADQILSLFPKDDPKVLSDEAINMLCAIDPFGKPQVLGKNIAQAQLANDIAHFRGGKDES